MRNVKRTGIVVSFDRRSGVGMIMDRHEILYQVSEHDIEPSLVLFQGSYIQTNNHLLVGQTVRFTPIIDGRSMDTKHAINVTDFNLGKRRH